jgi:hypothetical protein
MQLTTILLKQAIMPRRGSSCRTQLPCTSICTIVFQMLRRASFVDLQARHSLLRCRRQAHPIVISRGLFLFAPSLGTMQLAHDRTHRVDLAPIQAPSCPVLLVNLALLEHCSLPHMAASNLHCLQNVLKSVRVTIRFMSSSKD